MSQTSDNFMVFDAFDQASQTSTIVAANLNTGQAVGIAQVQGSPGVPGYTGDDSAVVHSQANNPSFPHLIGGHGDWVWPYGKFNNQPDEGLETWDVVAGGTAAAMYTFRQEGVYAYLNHNLIKAFSYDAKAFIHAVGEWDDALMTNSFGARAITGN